MYSGLSPHFDAVLGPVEMLPKHALDIARDAGASQTDPADNENPAFECRRGSRRYFSWVECKSFRFRSASFRLEALLFGVEDSYCSQAEMVPRMCTRCGPSGRTGYPRLFAIHFYSTIADSGQLSGGCALYPSVMYRGVPTSRRIV